MITIEHNHENGTTIDGSTKGDSVLQILRGLHDNWRWFPSIATIGIGQSRDRVAKRHAINRAADALRAAGHEVTVTIDDTPRDRATVLADQATRLDDRADALAAKAARKTAEVDALWDKSHDLVKNIPFGQPILVGHHSEGRHRRILDRSANLARKACALAPEVREVALRASVVGDNHDYSLTPAATALRIPRLEAEIGRLHRALDDHDPDGSDWELTARARLAQVRDQLDHDRMLLGKAIEAGTWTPHSPDTIKPGDLISLRGNGSDPRVVIKVNKKTVGVATRYSWLDKVRYEEIRWHQRTVDPDKAAAVVAEHKKFQAEQAARVAGWPSR